MQCYGCWKIWAEKERKRELEREREMWETCCSDFGGKPTIIMRSRKRNDLEMFARRRQKKSSFQKKRDRKRKRERERGERERDRGRILQLANKNCVTRCWEKTGVSFQIIFFSVFVIIKVAAKTFAFCHGVPCFEMNTCQTGKRFRLKIVKNENDVDLGTNTEKFDCQVNYFHIFIIKFLFYFI